SASASRNATPACCARWARASRSSAPKHSKERKHEQHRLDERRREGLSARQATRRRAARNRSRRGTRRVPRAHGAVRFRQDDVAESDRRSRSAGSWRDHGGRRAARHAPPEQAHQVARAARRIHLPVLQLAARVDGRAQRRGAAAADEAQREGTTAQRRGRTGARRARGPRQAQARRAVGRPATARRDRARARQRSVAARLRRADRRSRSRDLGCDPRALAAAEPHARQNHSHGHARSASSGARVAPPLRRQRRPWAGPSRPGRMKFLPLVWAGLWRKRVRTVLAMISVAIAFWLYGTLDAVTASFDDALTAMTSEVRLRAQSRQNVRAGLPLAYRARIEAVSGVRDVGLVAFVGGYYQGSVDFIEVSAIDIERIDAGGSFDVDPAYVEAMRRLRTGAVIGPELVRRYGWKIGDRVTVRSPMWAKED